MAKERELTKEEKDWVKMAVDNKVNEKDIKKELKKEGYSEEEQKKILEYFYKLDYEKRRGETDEAEREIEKEKEKEFEEQVNKYNEDKGSLTKKEKKEVERFLKEVKKFQRFQKKMLESSKQTKNKIDSIKNTSYSKAHDEEEKLKIKMSEALLQSKDILEIEHPHYENTEITEGNLKECSTDELIGLLEDNVEELNNFLKGKA